MKLSDQIELLRDILTELGVTDADYGQESVGEMAAGLLKAQNELLKSDAECIAALQEESGALAEGRCESCVSFKPVGHIPRLCQNVEAYRRKHARRGYSTPAGHGCPLCERAS
jgi:hypothetical protein